MKEFYTHQQQLDKLKERNLKIEEEQEKSVLEHLKRVGYYNIINGYSKLFKSKDENGDNHYSDDATFDNILALYNFDKALRSTLYKYTSSIECYVKEAIAHEFSRVHSVKEEDYLKEECFSSKHPDDVKSLIEECKNVIKESTNDKTSRFRSYLTHTKNKHGHVPMWILIRALTFGKASIFFKNMLDEEKEKIACDYNLTPNQMSTMLEFVVFFRNIVAHGERTFCTKAYRTRIPAKLNIISNLTIPRNKDGSYKYGRSDFLALLICCKYFLPSEEFAGLIEEVDSLFEIVSSLSDTRIRKIKIEMGLVNIDLVELSKAKTKLVKK